MNNLLLNRILLHLAVVSLCAAGAAPAAFGESDLSRYREFQLGSPLAAVTRITGLGTEQVTVVQKRPGLIQDLTWRPQAISAAGSTDSATEVVFRFFNGELCQITVNYDRYQTEGLTKADLVDSISGALGQPGTAPTGPRLVPDQYHDSEEVLAQWQNARHLFELLRFPYGPSYKLVGVLKPLELKMQASRLEAARLDELEAPQREAARAAAADKAGQTKLDKARLVNKPKFRP